MTRTVWIVVAVAAVWVACCLMIAGAFLWVRYGDRPTPGRVAVQHGLEQLTPLETLTVCTIDFASEGAAVWLLNRLGLDDYPGVTDSDIRAALQTVC